MADVAATTDAQLHSIESQPVPSSLATTGVRAAATAVTAGPAAAASGPCNGDGSVKNTADAGTNKRSGKPGDFFCTTGADLSVISKLHGYLDPPVAKKDAACAR